MIDAIKAVGVLGLGVMGFDIAFLYAQRGYRTLVFDASETAMNRVAIRRDQTIARLKKKNRISDAEAERVSHGLMPAAGLPALTSSDLVTETVSESGKTKKSVYTRSALSTSVRVAAGRAVEIGRSAGNRGFYFYRGTKISSRSIGRDR
jgi:3-hydroxyacyl-CoA dehydrogenase